MSTIKEKELIHAPLNHKRARGSKSTRALMFILAAFIAASMIRQGCSERKKSNSENSSNNIHRKSSYSDRDYFELKVGDTIRVEPPDGFNTIDCFSGGTAEMPHKYYHRNQNGPWEIWGDGTDHGNSNGAWIQMTAFDDEPIEIECDYSYKKNN